MIFMLAFFYLVLCFLTDTFTVNIKWGFYLLIFGACYDIIMQVIAMRNKNGK